MYKYKVLNYNKWKNVEKINVHDDPIIIFCDNEICYSGLERVRVKEVSTYKIIGENLSETNFEVFLLKNKKIFTKPIFFLNKIQIEILLFLFSSYYKNSIKHLILSEKIFNKFKFFIDIYNFIVIYKNGNYIIKKNFVLYDFHKSIKIISIIYYLVYNFNNKYSADHERLNLIKDLCNTCGIEYELYENHIIIFMLTEKNLEYKNNTKKEMIFPYENKYYVLAKIGKYVLFI